MQLQIVARCDCGSGMIDQQDLGQVAWIRLGQSHRRRDQDLTPLFPVVVFAGVQAQERISRNGEMLVVAAEDSS